MAASDANGAAHVKFKFNGVQSRKASLYTRRMRDVFGHIEKHPGITGDKHACNPENVKFYIGFHRIRPAANIEMNGVEAPGLLISTVRVR